MFSEEKTIKPSDRMLRHKCIHVQQVHLMEHRCSGQVRSAGRRQISSCVRAVCICECVDFTFSVRPGEFVQTDAGIMFCSVGSLFEC